MKATHTLAAALSWMAAVLVFGAGTEAEAQTRVELITMGQGNAVFARFGHAAACVFDSVHPNGRCYNYGTASFSSPLQLTWDVLQGRAEFWLSVTSYKKMVRSYTRADRTLWRQVLPLTEPEARALAARFAHDAKPENRAFVYHHFEDNCATRLRDHIDAAYDGRLLAATEGHEGDTLRRHVRDGFASDLALLTLSDVLLGRPLDKPRTRWEAMFLPKLMRAEVEDHIGAVPEVIYARKGAPFEGRAMGGVWFLMILGAVVGLLSLVSVCQRKSAALRWLGQASPAFLMMLVALLVWIPPIISAMPELWQSEAMLIFWPTDGLLIFLRGRWQRRYVQARLAGLALVMAMSGLVVLVQPLWGLVVLAGLSLAPVLWAWRPEESQGVDAAA